MDKFKIFTGYMTKDVITPEVAKFPGGEIRVNLKLGKIELKEFNDVIVTAMLFSSDDVMTLVMITDALREAGIQTIHAVIPYVPYARQDRVCNKGESLSIRAFARIINSLNFASVEIYDPHSDVTPALLNNCTIQSRADCMREHKEMMNWLYGATGEAPVPYYLVSPDAGSVKKSYEIAKAFPQFKGIIFADKVRDVATGKLSGTTISNVPDDIMKSRVLVCDDIGDGFGTFLPLAEQLRAYNPKDLNIYVTHGIFSRGEDILHPLYDNVWCTVDFRKYK